MKCALIIPAWQPEELFPTKTAGSQLNYWQPLGTLYVAACLKHAGHEVAFYNGAFLSTAQILEKIRAFAPRCVGIYATTFGWYKARQSAVDIKAIDKSIFVCVGGPYPIALQAECLKDNNVIDAVVTGEAEITFTRLVNRLAQNFSLQGIKGVAYRHNGQIICNPPRPLIENLDAIPFPARELLDNVHQYLPPPASYKRKPVAVILTSRGCNRRCIFCSQIDSQRHSGKRGIRFRSIENVLTEVQWCLDNGYREIKFIDDTLAADYERLMRFTAEIKRRHLNFTWFASVCANQVDKTLLQAMKEAGCWAVLIGAESGVQKQLNTLRKGITLQHICNAVNNAKQVGLSVTTPFLFGIPGQTFADGLKTIEFARQLNPDYANFHALTAFPGTYLYEHRDRYGQVSNDLQNFTYQGASFVPFSMSRAQIQELRQLAFKRFYSRPGYLVRRALLLRSWIDCKAAMSGLKSLLWLWLKKDLFSNGTNTAKAPPIKHY